jgi:hypothetical protein
MLHRMQRLAPLSIQTDGQKLITKTLIANDAWNLRRQLLPSQLDCTAGEIQRSVIAVQHLVSLLAALLTAASNACVSTEAAHTMALEANDISLFQTRIFGSHGEQVFIDLDVNATHVPLDQKPLTIICGNVSDGKAPTVAEVAFRSQSTNLWKLAVLLPFSGEFTTTICWNNSPIVGGCDVPTLIETGAVFCLLRQKLCLFARFRVEVSVLWTFATQRIRSLLGGPRGAMIRRVERCWTPALSAASMNQSASPPSLAFQLERASQSRSSRTAR